jgi:hypothetical protein
MTRRRLILAIVTGVLVGMAWWLSLDRLSAGERLVVGTWTFDSKSETWIGSTVSVFVRVGTLYLPAPSAPLRKSARSPAIGRTNWLHVGGDGGLKTASVLLSVCASATRHRLNPWSYLRDVLDQLAGRSAGGDLGDLVPDVWAIHSARPDKLGKTPSPPKAKQSGSSTDGYDRPALGEAVHTSLTVAGEE